MNDIKKKVFLVLILLIIFNINGIIHIFFDVSGALRYLYLLLVGFLILTSSNILLYNIFSRSRYIVIFLLCYLVFGTIGTIMNDNWEDWTINILPWVISLLVSYTIAAFLASEIVSGNFNYWMNIIFISTVIAGSSGIIFSVLGINQYGNYITYYERAAGIFANPNELGFVANMSLVFLLYSMHKQSKFFYIILVLVATYGSYLTYSKGSIITTVVIWLNYFIMFLVNKTNGKSKVYLYLIASFIFIVLAFNLKVLNDNSELTIEQNRRIYHILDIFSGNITDEATSGRIDIFEYGFDKILDNPFIGYGIGTFAVLDNRSHGIHNAFLMVLGESGIISFLILVSILLILLISPWLRWFNRGEKYLISSMFIVIVIYMMGTHGVFHSKFFILYLIFIGVFIDNISMQKSKLKLK